MKLHRPFHVILWSAILSYALLPPPSPPQGSLTLPSLPPLPKSDVELRQPFWIQRVPLSEVISTLNGWEIRVLHEIYTLQGQAGHPSGILPGYGSDLGVVEFLREIAPGSELNGDWTIDGPEFLGAEFEVHVNKISDQLLIHAIEEKVVPETVIRVAQNIFAQFSDRVSPVYKALVLSFLEGSIKQRVAALNEWYRTFYTVVFDNIRQIIPWLEPESVTIWKPLQLVNPQGGLFDVEYHGQKIYVMDWHPTLANMWNLEGVPPLDVHAIETVIVTQAENALAGAGQHRQALVTLQRLHTCYGYFEAC
jgi:hypothetical protein